MVYCGKPSKACEACRVRKTKCDLKRPSCGQCQRTRRRCPGYRNELELSFRDESATVVRKNKSRPMQSRAESVRVESLERGIVATAMEPLDEKSFLTSASASASLSTQYKEMAIPFFISHHVIQPTARTRGCMDYTLHILNSNENKSSASPLDPAVKAVGLATYANIVKSPFLLRLAVMEYVHALRLTNSSLSSPTEAIKETVMTSVLLLSTFESITCTANKNLVAWNNHVKGSIQLLYLRGARQFETSHGIAMWSQLTANILSSCIQRQCHVPPTLIALRNHMKRRFSQNPFYWRSLEVMTRFCNLLADFRLKKISGHEFVDAATSIDNAFVANFSKPMLPDHMDFHSIFVDAPNEVVYEHCCSIYTDWQAGSGWNHARLGRLYMNQMIHEETRKLLYEGQHLHIKRRQAMLETLRKTSATIKQLALDICASVPQLAGYASSLPLPSAPPNTRFSHISEDYHTPSGIKEPREQGLPFSPPAQSRDFAEDNPNSEMPPSSTYSAMSLLWPLYTVGACDIISQEMKLWVVDRLEYLGHTMGLGQSLMIARALRERGRIVMYRDEFEELVGPLPVKAVVDDVGDDDEDAPGSEAERRNLELGDHLAFESEISGVDPQ